MFSDTPHSDFIQPRFSMRYSAGRIQLEDLTYEASIHRSEQATEKNELIKRRQFKILLQSDQRHLRKKYSLLDPSLEFANSICLSHTKNRPTVFETRSCRFSLLHFRQCLSSNLHFRQLNGSKTRIADKVDMRNL
jgi:hypothetical protein